MTQDGKRVTRVVHLKRDDYDVRIDRCTKWGNPYRVGEHGDREDVIRRYRDYIMRQPHLLAALPELHGKRLGCWCAPLPCHGDVLAELADEGCLRAEEQAAGLREECEMRGLPVNAATLARHERNHGLAIGGMRAERKVRSQLAHYKDRVAEAMRLIDHAGSEIDKADLLEQVRAVLTLSKDVV